MNKKPIEEILTDKINFHKQRLVRIQKAIDCLDGSEDKDILEALLIGRAYLLGGVHELELLSVHC